MEHDNFHNMFVYDKKLTAINPPLFLHLSRCGHRANGLKRPETRQTSSSSCFEVQGGTNNTPKTREPE